MSCGSSRLRALTGEERISSKSPRDDAIALRWNRVALAVAHKTGKRNGLDISTRRAMNAVFAPDREHAGDRKPQPFSQADELKGTLALKPFRLQFVSSAPDREPSIGEKSSRFKLWMRRAQSSPLRMSHRRPEDRIAHPRQ